jgi:hypothetical protein
LERALSVWGARPAHSPNVVSVNSDVIDTFPRAFAEGLAAHFIPGGGIDV